jgi:TRAP transporter TAXI family solute receptor
MVGPARLFIFSILLAFAFTSPSAAQRGDPYAEASNWTIGLMTGALDGTSLRMANDMAVVLDNGPDLRIVPMIGESSIRNVTDLTYLKGVDIAIIQADVLSLLRRTKRMPGIEDQLQYLAKLHSEEFHVLSRMKYLCLADLSGRKVNFGPAGSGSALTAQAIFETSKVQVQPQYLDYATAADKLRKGELDALVFVSGKPSAAFDHIRYADGVHFLDVDFLDELQRDYLPAILTHDDYPDLIAENETVSTIAVSAVLAVAKSAPKSDRYRKLERFVEAFFGKIDQFRTPTRHAKWREVALSAPVAGWTRFPAAQQWLKDHPESAAARTTSATLDAEFGGLQNLSGVTEPEARKIQALFEMYKRDRGSAGKEDSEKLFSEFIRWYQQRSLN